MGFQEKLIWGQFLPTLVICGLYAAGVAKGEQGGRLPSMFSMMVVLAMVQVVYSVLVAAMVKREPRDERDRLFEYRAFKVAYLAAMAAAFCWAGAAAMHVQPIAQWTGVQAVLGAWFGVEVVRTGTLLLLYRTGMVRA